MVDDALAGAEDEGEEAEADAEVGLGEGAVYGNFYMLSSFFCLPSYPMFSHPFQCTLL